MATLKPPTTSTSNRRPTRRVLLGACLLVIAAAGIAEPLLAQPKGAVEFRVIVNPENQMRAVSRAFLSGAFLKGVTRWEGGAVIRPVDQRADAAVRNNFSQHVLNRSMTAVRSYWQQRIFSGRDVPPPELDSDEAVVAYVASRPGAIGYVSLTAKLGRAREIAVE